MVGELVFPLVIVGITEASITRNPATPRTRSRSSDTAMGLVSTPILAVPTGWNSRTHVPGGARKLVITNEMGTGFVFLRTKFLQRGRAYDAPDEPQCVNCGALIFQC